MSGGVLDAQPWGSVQRTERESEASYGTQSSAHSVGQGAEVEKPCPSWCDGTHPECPHFGSEAEEPKFKPGLGRFVTKVPPLSKR